MGSMMSLMSLPQTTSAQPLQYILASFHESHPASMGVSGKSPAIQEIKGITSDLARWVRSQLVSGGLTRFDDQPDNYLGWRSTFKRIVEGLDLSAHEQIGLLIK